jgi:hypothetical protein
MITLVDGVAVASIAAAVVAIVKYVVRSEIKTQVDTLPERLHVMIDEHVEPIEKRLRKEELKTAEIEATLVAHKLMDSGQHRRYEDSNGPDSSKRIKSGDLVFGRRVTE